MKRLDQRESRDSLITFYRNQARLARMGFSTRRSAEFYDRQVMYFQQEQR